MKIDFHLLYNQLMMSRENFLNIRGTINLDETRDYYDGLADGVLSVMEYINDNKDYLCKKDDAEF